MLHKTVTKILLHRAICIAYLNARFIGQINRKRRRKKRKADQIT